MEQGSGQNPFCIAFPIHHIILSNKLLKLKVSFSVTLFFACMALLTAGASDVAGEIDQSIKSTESNRLTFESTV